MLEQRKKQRFKVEWEILVSGKDSAGLSFNERGLLDNLSSRGAFLYLNRPVLIGTRLGVWIKVPYDGERWMHYSAEVIRVETPSAKTGIAIRFIKVSPKFTSMPYAS